MRQHNLFFPGKNNQALNCGLWSVSLEYTSYNWKVCVGNRANNTIDGPYEAGVSLLLSQVLQKIETNASISRGGLI